PFHAKVLEKFRLEPSATLGTMGVSASADGVRLLFSPAFVLSLPPDQLGGVLLHEVHHVVFEHPLIRREDYPDHWAFTVSLELSVNEFVKEPLPDDAITLKQFPDLPPMEPWLERYRRLCQVRKKDRLPIDQPVDDHDIWSEAQADPTAAREALDDLIQDAAMSAGGVPRDLADAMEKQIADRLPGDTAGDGVQIWQGDEVGVLDWKTLLRRYLGRLPEPTPDYAYPPRRFPHLIGLLPGRRRRAGRARVVAVIDTSFSVGEAELEAM